MSNLKFPLGKTYYGTPKTVLAKFCEEYGLGYVVTNDNHVLMYFTQNKLELHFSEMLQANVSLIFNQDLVNRPPVDFVAEDRQFNFRNGTDSIVLNGDTGLLGLPVVKTKTVTKQYSAAVEASEKVFIQKQVIGKVNKKGEAIIDKETGKQKLKVPKTKKVLRRTVEAVCLINTAIEPQNYVTLSLREDNELTGDYRVRTVAIDGDTEAGNWNMTLSLEGEW